MSKLKVCTILGTRPEIIRLARVMARLDDCCEHVLIHTGQNSDYELNEVFFEDLQVKRPDHFLSISRDSLGAILGGVLIKCEEVLKKEQPDAVLVLGDTNSCFGAVIARRMKIPVYHMEAGNRCYDFNVPEELNRRIVDHVSDFNLVYTEHARRNLLSEGCHPRKVYLTGSPMKEVLDFAKPQIDQSDVLQRLGLESDGYFLVSLHRAENVDIPSHLTDLLHMLRRLTEEYGVPVIMTTHPRTRQKLDALGTAMPDNVQFLKPFGYHDYVKLQIEAKCTVSDSGTISEESSILGFPAVTPRNSIERPEAMDSGHIVVTGLNPERILDGVRLAIATHEAACDSPIPAEYAIANTSLRVAKLIVGTASLIHRWDGIVKPA